VSGLVFAVLTYLLRPPPPPPTIGPAGTGLAIAVFQVFVLVAFSRYSASGPMVGVWCRHINLSKD
jgi:hypothetical protein